MIWRWAVVLLLPALSSCAIAIDTSAAASIPAEIAVAQLRGLLPTVAYFSCLTPQVTVDQIDIEGWTVDEKGLEIRTKEREPFKISWSESRGAEAVKIPLLRYEVRLFVADGDKPRKEHFHFNWKDEEPARKAAELLEALRGDK